MKEQGTVSLFTHAQGFGGFFAGRDVFVNQHIFFGEIIFAGNRKDNDPEPEILVGTFGIHPVGIVSHLGDLNHVPFFCQPDKVEISELFDLRVVEHGITRRRFPAEQPQVRFICCKGISLLIDHLSRQRVVFNNPVQKGIQPVQVIHARIGGISCHKVIQGG